MISATVAKAPNKFSATTSGITCGPCDLKNCPVSHGPNMLPAEEPTRKNPVILPDSPSVRSASPNTFGKTGATASPNPIAQSHRTNGAGAKTRRPSGTSSAIERLTTISGAALNLTLIQIVARRPTLNAVQNPQFK